MMSITEDDLKEMYTHESLQLDKFTSVLRVPNGWIYKLPKGGNVFVPEMVVTQEYVLPRK